VCERIRKEPKMEDLGKHTTGTKDEHYNLISVLYPALHGADNCDHYAMDAEAASDRRVSTFFREAQAAQVQIAQRGKELLGIVESPPEFDVGSGGVLGEGPTEAWDPTGRGRPPAASAMSRTGEAGEEDLRGRGVPPRSDAPRDEGLTR
jgi:hypothetical protein